jgi:membrane dipeptidase
MHADIPWDIENNPDQSGAPVRSVLDARHFSKLNEGGVAGFNAIIWVESKFKPDRALYRGLEILDSVLEDVKRSTNFRIARNSKELTQIFESGSAIALILGIEGAELIEDNLSLLRTFYNLGVRSFGFVWNERNLLADGYGEVHRRNGGSGLSEFGIKVLQECNRLGMIVDGAHITPNGLSDMLEYSKDPIIVSHGSTSVHPDTLRPMSDEHLRAIAKNNGVAGIFAINKNNSIPDLESYVDHVEHAVKIAGADHVGLGFDFVDFLHDEPAASGNVTVANLENHRFCQYVIQSLRTRGLKDTDIDKIASQNFIRVLQEVTD